MPSPERRRLAEWAAVLLSRALRYGERNSGSGPQAGLNDLVPDFALGCESGRSSERAGAGDGVVAAEGGAVIETNVAVL